MGRSETAARRPVLPGPAARVRQGQHIRQDPQENRHVYRQAGLRPRDSGHRVVRCQVAVPVGARHREIWESVQVSVQLVSSHISGSISSEA